MKLKRSTYAPALLSAFLVMASCGARPANEESFVNDKSTLGPDASVEQLVTAFAPCEGAESAPAAEFIASTTEWFEVTSIIEATREPSEAEPNRRTYPITFQGTSSESGELSELTMNIHMVDLAGGEWAILNGGRAFFGVADPVWGEGTIGMVIAETPTGQVFFSGECRYDNFQAPLEEVFGEDFDDTMLRAVQVTGPELAQVLGVKAS